MAIIEHDELLMERKRRILDMIRMMTSAGRIFHPQHGSGIRQMKSGCDQIIVCRILETLEMKAASCIKPSVLLSLKCKRQKIQYSQFEGNDYEF
jgi:hypothetical protein